VQAVTGPDGCLYVVDMYRFVIEHPRWIPKEDLAKLDVRAGSPMGRIYRIRPRTRAPRPTVRLDKLDTTGLVKALDSANGTQRDLAHMMLLWRGDRSAAKLLRDLVQDGKWPQARLHALCLLDGLGLLRRDSLRVQFALRDEHPGVRRQALRLTEGRYTQINGVLEMMAQDADPQVRLQAALSMGAWPEPQFSGGLLGNLAVDARSDAYLRAAVLSSINKANVADVLRRALHGTKTSARLIRQLVSVAAALGQPWALTNMLRDGNLPAGGRYPTGTMLATAGLLETLQRRGQGLETLQDRQVQARIKAMIAGARAMAADGKAGLDERLAAVDLLGRLPADRPNDLTALARLVTPQTPPALQAGAVSALGRIADPQVPGLLTAAWRSASPALQSQIADVLLSRDAWLRHLLHGIEKKQVPAAQVSPAQRQRLLNHRDQQVRALAVKLFAGSTSADRQKVLAGYGDVPKLSGHAARGQAIFAKTCAACHRLGNVGKAVGPDLATVTNRTPEFLLIAVLDPNREVDPRYVEYVAVTKSGRSLTGLLAGETATSITLRAQEGREETVLRSELEELQSTGRSMMPEGLEKDLSRQDLADLFAFVRAAGLGPKKLPGNMPAVIRATRGRLILPARAAEIYGGEITFEEPFQNIGYWHGSDDRAVWTVVADHDGTYDVWLDFACADSSANNGFVLEGARPVLGGKVTGTGGWDRYRQLKIGSITLAAGKHRLTFRPANGKLRGALLDLRSIHLVPPGQQPAVDAARAKQAAPPE
jgi:putative heme-binding domain-containing protein